MAKTVVLTNNAVSTFAAGIGTGDTQIVVPAGEGALFPSLSAGQFFPLTAVKDDGSREIMRCTARSGDTLTVSRAQEGTTALAFNSGEIVELRLTAGVIDELATLIDNNDANITSLQNIIGGYGDIVSRNLTVSTNDPSGGADGDLWFKYIP